MRIELRQESPLVGARNLLTDAPQHMLDQVRIQERPFLELNNIRGNSAEPEFVQAIKDVVGVDLPVRPNTVAVGRAYALWRSEEHTSGTPVTNAHLVCRLLLEKKKPKPKATIVRKQHRNTHQSTNVHKKTKR